MNSDDYIKEYGSIKNMMRIKHDLICHSGFLSGGSTYSMLACSRALREDSEKQLKASEKRVEDYIAGFDGTEELGLNRAQFYKLYKATQQAWSEYVRQQCALHTYELQPPGLDMETDACIAVENYIRAERLITI